MTCDRPTVPGWHCTRAQGHEPPCTLAPADHVALTLDGACGGLMAAMRWRPNRRTERNAR